MTKEDKVTRPFTEAEKKSLDFSMRMLNIQKEIKEFWYDYHKKKVLKKSNFLNYFKIPRIKRLETYMAHAFAMEDKDKERGEIQMNIDRVQAQIDKGTITLTKDYQNLIDKYSKNGKP